MVKKIWLSERDRIGAICIGSIKEVAGTYYVRNDGRYFICKSLADCMKLLECIRKEYHGGWIDVE